MWKGVLEVTCILALLLVLAEMIVHDLFDKDE